MSGPPLEVLGKALWTIARHPLVAAAWAISTGKRGLISAGSRIQRRMQARLRAALCVFVLSVVGLTVALAGGVFLLMGLWGSLATYLGPNGASLSLGIALLGGSMLPLAMAARRATARRRTRD
jgi:hypothetical protein